jgi:hypothetical protein
MNPYRSPCIPRWLLLWCLLLGQTAGALAEEQHFSLDATIEAEAGQVQGRLTLAVTSGQTVYRPRLRLWSRGGVQDLAVPRPLPPGGRETLAFALPGDHPLPGAYHLLVELLFQDQSGVWLNAPFALRYLVGGEPPPIEGEPSLRVAGGRLEWGDIPPAVQQPRVRVTAGPLWVVTGEYSPGDTRLRLLADAAYGAPFPSHIYPQLARLDWQQGGFHYSRVLPWELRGDSLDAAEPAAGPSPWPWLQAQFWSLERSLWLGGVLALGMAVALTLGGMVRGRRRGGDGLSRQMAGWLIALGLSLFVAGALRVGLWLTPTLTTGGDTGSHVFYAQVFSDWLREGKISGWLPEVFAGLPAFRYYFPLPFVSIAALGEVIGIPVAFKWISMLPAALLPLAAYWLAGRWHWPVPARVGAALAATGFLFTTATSIWGGNLLAALAGEFAYAWGLLLTLLFWGTLSWGLERGGRRWLLAALLEVAVALCHGYALLVAGFGALLLPLFAARPLRALMVVLGVHTLAFLLLGGWLLPLAENLPWTIPNDTGTPMDDLSILWPATLLPLILLGLPAALLVWWRLPASRAPLLQPLLIALLGLLLFVLAQRLHLAEIRFYPYVQLLTALFLGGAIGWALWQWGRAPLWWALAAVLFLPRRLADGGAPGGGLGALESGGL